MGAPVVGDVPGENLLPLIEVSGSHGVRVIPAMPEIAGAELPGLPAEVLLLPLADSEGLIAEELGIPLGEAKLPRHSGAAEGPLPLVPATVHCTVPGEGYAVLAQEDRFHSPGCPVLEPVGHLLDGDEVDVEIARVHRAEIARGMMVDDAARVQGLHDGLGTQRE